MLSCPGGILLAAYQSALVYGDLTALILMIKSGELVTRVFGPIRAMGPRVIVRACGSDCIAKVDAIFLAYFGKNPTLVDAESCFRKPEVCPSC